MSASSLRPDESRAAPATITAPPPELQAVEAAFAEGQAHFDARDFLAAARSWARAEALLPASAEHLDNRRVLLEKIASAYARELARDPGPELARAVLVEIDTHAHRLQTLHPDEPLPEAWVEVRRTASEILREADHAGATRIITWPLKPLETSPRVAPPPPAKIELRPHRKSLTIAGGITLGASAAMVGMFVASMLRANNLQDRFDDPNNGCTLKELEGTCAEIYRVGRISDRAAVGGLILGPLLLVAGSTMLAVTTHRKALPPKLAPLIRPNTVGLALEHRF